MSEIDIFREYLLSRSDHLSSQSVLGKPAMEEEIVDFETQYGINFPPDVREYFLKINGLYVSGGFVALGALKNWRLLVEDEFIPAKHSREILTDADKYFKFGTYDILVWSWSIKLNSNATLETPIVVTYMAATKVANGFTSFLQQFRMEDPVSLLGL